ncbi:MAG: TolC family protein [Thermoanaerobaculia bacterium]
MIVQRLCRVLLGCSLALLAAAPATRAAGPAAPESPNRPWIPAAGEKLAPLPLPAPSPTAAGLRPGTQVSLAQVLDLALANSPRTRATWLAARAAAAEIGVRRAELYPTVELEADVTRSHQSALGGTGFTFERTTYGPIAALSWLLFDFGGRSADLGDARYALMAANWTHDAEIQNVVLAVAQAYYQYLGAAAQYAALGESIRRAEANLAAAEERRTSGVATIADVLQARTALAQERLDLARIAGTMKSIQGALATAIGVRPDLEVELGDLPADVDVGGTATAVGGLLERALADRPDLLAARSAALAARQRVRKERADGLPTLELLGAASRLDSPSADRAADNYSLQLALRVPLFTGFDRHYRIERAEAEAQAQESAVDRLAQQVMLEVWTSYYDLQAAAQQVATGRSLLESAAQSAEVAAGRYRAGVGSILDLLTAESALAAARAQEIQARSTWFVALAALQHDLGGLAADGPATPGKEPATP